MGDRLLHGDVQSQHRNSQRIFLKLFMSFLSTNNSLLPTLNKPGQARAAGWVLREGYFSQTAQLNQTALLINLY